MDDNLLARVEECLLMCDPKGLQVSGPTMKVTAYFGAPSLLAECCVELSNATRKLDVLLAALRDISNLPAERQDESTFIANDAISKVTGEPQ